MALRVFHTADWHLGQTLHAFDRDHEHARFLEWLLDALAKRQPDVLLVAGDVFDTINPSALAQRRYFEFLAAARSRRPDLQIIITAGNHDAAARLEAPAALLQALGIGVVGTVPRTDEGRITPERFIVPLKNAAGVVEALALAVPFLRPADVPAVAAAADPYLDGIRELYAEVTRAAEDLRARQYPTAALIALGHLHLTGSDESRDSERRVVIGGSEAVTPAAFPSSLAYVALGHLHKPQQFENGRICYSGSPIPLSFSERTYRHRVVELDFEHGRLIASTSLAIPPVTPLLRVPERGAVSLPDLAAQLDALPLSPGTPAEEHPLLEVNILEDRPNPDLRRSVEQALMGRALRLAVIKRVTNAPADATPPSALANVADLNSLQPEELLRDYHRERFGTEPDEAVLRALREITIGTP